MFERSLSESGRSFAGHVSVFYGFARFVRVLLVETTSVRSPAIPICRRCVEAFMASLGKAMTSTRTRTRTRTTTTTTTIATTNTVKHACCVRPCKKQKFVFQVFLLEPVAEQMGTADHKRDGFWTMMVVTRLYTTFFLAPAKVQ